MKTKEEERKEKKKRGRRRIGRRRRERRGNGKKKGKRMRGRRRRRVKRRRMVRRRRNIPHPHLFSFFFFFFRLFPSGVATADFLSPVYPINCILLRHLNLSNVLFHHIHKPPFWPSPFPLSWQLHPQHPSPNIPIIFPPKVSVPQCKL